MKLPFLAAALLASTIMASESSAQGKPSADTSMVKIFRGTDTARFIRFAGQDVLAGEVSPPPEVRPSKLTRADSLAIRQAAARFVQMEKDTAATLPRFGIKGDTVLVFTWVEKNHIGLTGVRVMRRNGKWVAVSSEGHAIK